LKKFGAQEYSESKRCGSCFVLSSTHQQTFSLEPLSTSEIQPGFVQSNQEVLRGCLIYLLGLDILSFSTRQFDLEFVAPILNFPQSLGPIMSLCDSKPCRVEGRVRAKCGASLPSHVVFFTDFGELRIL
jgi:hypothetical protein